MLVEKMLKDYLKITKEDYVLKDIYKQNELKQKIQTGLGTVLGYVFAVLGLSIILYLLWNNIVYPYPTLKITFRQALAGLLFLYFINGVVFTTKRR